MRIAIVGVFLTLALSAQSISLAQVELNSGQPEKSLAELWSAAAQNPKSAAARIDVGFAHLSLNRLQQAEWAARESLDLDPANSRAQLLLGWTLARQYRYTFEALDELRRAAHSYPQAHLGAADVLAHQGSVTEARAEVEAYLASGAAEYRKIAEGWLKLLSLQ
jgi:tetratricopeptide (TPR) repeat protein